MSDTNNVIGFPRKEESFEEKFEKLVTETENLQVPPDGELEKSLLLAIMNDDKAETDRLGDMITRRNKAGIQVVK